MIKQAHEAFEKWVEQFDTESDQYQDMGADEYFAAGYMAAMQAVRAQGVFLPMEQLG